MDVCNLQAFNLALIFKWRWRFFHDIHALWVALVIYNYYRRRRAYDLHNSLSEHVSPFWRGVLKASTTFASDIKIVGMVVQQDFNLTISR